MSDSKDLIAGYLDDSLTEEERQKLAVWLKAHPDNLRRFVEANLFNENLRAAVSSHCQREAMEAFSPNLGILPWLKVRLATRMPLRGLLASPAGMAVAAALALVALVLLVDLLRPSASGSGAVSWARVVQTRSTQVSASTPSLQADRPVPARRIGLLAGAVELSLHNGVTIVFEGPGDLELVTPMRVLLHSGQAVVRVPGNATGFQLETTAAQIVDLGTEFGVKCGPGGASEILVFDGKVVASASGKGAGFPLQLAAGTGTRFTSDQPNPTQIAYRPERFVRRFPADKPVELDEPGSALFNTARYEEVVVSRLERSLTIDGDLSDWSDVHSFRTVRNERRGEFIEGRMHYDEEFLYLGAHIGDPAPMRNVVDPATDGEVGWRGGGLQMRIATDPALGWPVEGNAAEYYLMRRMTTDAAQVAKATNSHLVHLTMWHHAPSAQPCLHLAFGMDFHSSKVNPPGYRAAYRKDAHGRGYTMEYALPWSLLNAPRVPHPGETLAISWTAHWSDQGGRLWRGQWVEIRNATEPRRIHTWERAATWGRAVFRRVSAEAPCSSRGVRPR
ncbi:MAG TPA: FecR domain-containing protein [Candidatus Paceibacterota bacterium]|nr:FecR domain-containing protein [Verrucomicrobiota bacterium]HRY50132.1 FecR domain-containing protein [Candidatus Paceibacterota bacterium]